MNGLILIPDRERQKEIDVGEHAYPEFRREAQRCAAYHGLDLTKDVIEFNIAQTKVDLRQQIINLVQARQGLEFIALICHGWQSGIQAGFDTSPNGGLILLASAIMSTAIETCRIVLYCCSTASGDHEGDGGFADELRDRTGMQVDGHAVSGHCTSNPMVRRMDAGPEADGGEWLVIPGSDTWSAWEDAVHDRDHSRGLLRFKYPFMSREDISASLKSA